jgi:branched-chain amino acid transport system permease protein
MRGALFGAIIVGFMRALALTFFPEIEIMAIYIVVVAMLLIRPYGMFGKAMP